MSPWLQERLFGVEVMSRSPAVLGEVSVARSNTCSQDDFDAHYAGSGAPANGAISTEP